MHNSGYVGSIKEFKLNVLITGSFDRECSFPVVSNYIHYCFSPICGLHLSLFGLNKFYILEVLFIFLLSHVSYIFVTR
jgi:hypothetical protein